MVGLLVRSRWPAGRSVFSLVRPERGTVARPPCDGRPPCRQASSPRPAAAFWTGGSGRVYRHDIYDFVRCPAPSRCAYVLVRRDGAGIPRVLHAGAATSSAPTLNLAHIRRLGARLGATEVHVHATLTGPGSHALRRIARDLRKALAQSPGLSCASQRTAAVAGDADGA
jgi:hypothetical protein